MSQVRRVLHVIPALAPRYGGPSAATIGMCRALEAAGLDVLVATTDADGDTHLDVALGSPVDFKGVRVVFFRRQFSEAFKWSSHLNRWLQSHVADFDVVHIHAVFSHAALAAGEACRRANVPYVLRPLGTLDPWSLRQKAFRKRLLLHWGGRQLIDGAAAMHYTSSEEGRLAESAIGRMPAGTVVPLGVDDALFATPERPESPSPYVLLLARLDAKKGVDLLIRAFHQAPARTGREAWKLVLAGDGSPAFVRDMKALAAGGPAADRIIFPGWIDGEAKTALLAGASLFALPSHQENFGISVVEAMAAGVPVVVTPGVNLGSAIADAGAGWVIEQTVDSLAEALDRAMSDSEERRQRGRKARLLARQFRWPAVAASLQVMYAHAAAGRASRSH